MAQLNKKGDPDSDSDGNFSEVEIESCKFKYANTLHPIQSYVGFSVEAGCTEAMTP